MIVRSFIRFRNFFYLIVDLLCLNLAFILAISLLFEGGLAESNRQALLNVLPSLNILYLILLWGLVFIHQPGKAQASFFPALSSPLFLLQF